MTLAIRDELRAADRQAVADIVRSSGFFNAEEEAVAVSLIDDCLSKGEASGYRFLFAERSGQVIGYACYGPIAGTQSGFDLYWIAVHADHRGQQIGRRLLEAAVAAARALHADRLYADTSSRNQYAPTRRFYQSNGFEQQAVLPDFYAPGDDKVIYCRRVPDVISI